MIEAMRLRIGHLSTFYHTAVLLMADDGFEDRIGCPVRWRLFGTGPAIVDALEREELDLAYIGLPPAVIGMARGVPIRCIAGGHMEGTVLAGPAEAPSHPAQPELGEILAAFRGRSIGVPGRGSIHDVILVNALRRAGLEGEVEVRNFRWADLVTEAYVRGEVAAAVGTPALAVALRRYGRARVLYPPYLLWPHNPSYGIVGRRDFLEERPETVERFLAAHEAATARIRKETENAARIISEHVRVVDPHFVLETLTLSPRYCAQLSGHFIRATLAFVPVLRELGYIDREPGEPEIFDPRFIERVHGPGDHYRNAINYCRLSPVLRLDNLHP